MFELKIFDNPQFDPIRTQVDDFTKEVVFNGNDVDKALGYADVKQALRDHTKGGVVLTTPLKEDDQWLHRPLLEAQKRTRIKTNCLKKIGLQNSL